MVDVLEDTRQYENFFNQVITDPLFLNMFISLLNVVTGAKEQETSLKSMKCH